MKQSLLLFSLFYFSIFTSILGFNCFAGIDNVYSSVKCQEGTKWCLKFENLKDSSDSIRQCDMANDCQIFGEKCSSVQVGNLTDLPNSQLQCCCSGDNCNSANFVELNTIFIILIVFILY